MTASETWTVGAAGIPALGFGTFRLQGGDVVRMVRHALNVGYRHIDTAQIYGNEAEVGEALAGSGIARADIFVTTKVWIENYRADALILSVKNSLKKLRSDYVDLLLLHWPHRDADLGETIGALNSAARVGLTRHIGLSNFNTSLMAEASRGSHAPLATNQIEYHPYIDQSVVLEAARRMGMSITAYYPMAEGKVLSDPVLAEIAAAHGKSAPQVALRWLIQQEGVAVLSKTLDEQRAKSNAAIFDFELSREEMSRIFGLAIPNGRLLNPKLVPVVWD